MIFYIKQLINSISLINPDILEIPKQMAILDTVSINLLVNGTYVTIMTIKILQLMEAIVVTHGEIYLH
jgi:hypothetical protein